jgi:hypothetical protein
MTVRTFVTLAIVGATMTAVAGAAFAQQNGSSRPVVKVQPAPWIPTPQLPPSIFPASPSFNGAGSDFFPAAPTDLFDNTTLTGYYFPVSNITADDANIPNNLDSDGDNTYYITQIDIAIYVPGTAQQPVQADFYIGTDPTNLSQIASFNGAAQSWRLDNLASSSRAASPTNWRLPKRLAPTRMSTTASGLV